MEWWDHTILEAWDDQQQLQNFQVSKQTFTELCEELVPKCQAQNIHFSHAFAEVGCHCLMEAGNIRELLVS